MDLLNAKTNEETAGFVRPGNRNNNLKITTRIFCCIPASLQRQKMKAGGFFFFFLTLGVLLGSFYIKFFKCFMYDKVLKPSKNKSQEST